MLRAVSIAVQSCLATYRSTLPYTSCVLSLCCGSQSFISGSCVMCAQQATALERSLAACSLSEACCHLNTLRVDAFESFCGELAGGVLGRWWCLGHAAAYAWVCGATRFHFSLAHCSYYGHYAGVRPGGQPASSQRRDAAPQVSQGCVAFLSRWPRSSADASERGNPR